MKKNIIILFILISILGLPGCNEQLNTVPTGSVSELIFWKSENDATLAVNAAYRELDGNGLVYLVTATDLAMHSPSGPQTLYDIAENASQDLWRLPGTLTHFRPVLCR